MWIINGSTNGGSGGGDDDNDDKGTGVGLKKADVCVWCVLQHCKRRIVVENPIRKASELILGQVPERKRNGGIGSCILTFDPRVLLISVLIQRM